MSQNDLNIGNQLSSFARVDINNALQALGSTNSGETQPTTTYANQLWYDTSANILKMRTEANDGWIRIGYLNQSTGKFSIFDNTLVVSTSGTQRGLLGDQTTSTWQAGTSTTESLVSPAKIKAAMLGASSLTTDGYEVLPSGLIMQWGRATSVNVNVNKTITFPIAFPTEIFTLQGTPNDNRASNDFEVDLYSVACKDTGSLSTFTLINEGTSSGNGQTIFWNALGK